MAEVHSLYGHTITPENVNEEVVSELERILAEAKRGEILCFAFAYLDGAECANSCVTGSSGRAAGLGGAITMMQHRYYASWRELTEK